GGCLATAAARHLLIFENRTEGHHLHWLRYITDDFLTTGSTISLALDYRPETKDRIHSHLPGLTDKISILSIYGKNGNLRGGGVVNALAACLEESGADDVFVDNLDEIASGCLRRAAVGINPPRSIRGRLSGVYFRPRFLANSLWPPGNILKEFGFRNLTRRKWFNRVFFMDEVLQETAQRRYPGQKFYFLPDPWDGTFLYDQAEARQKLGIPPDRFVFLCYGIGDRRKGLHLAVRAMLEPPVDPGLYLLCAGGLAPDAETARGLTALKEQGRATVLDRYVSDAEQSLCFCASDVVLLPYIGHFGSSGVLSLAAAAGRMVISSDEGLLARRIKENGLGWVFPSGNAGELKTRMHDALQLGSNEMAEFHKAAQLYAGTCSREAFRKALLAPFAEG
ncbi:MAG TPA: glycosyltransferase, partial [Syntrophales bacterium]|nr:glycosyltransferase [Syntrophales bacterium]